MNPFELADYVGFAGSVVAGVLVGRRMRPRPAPPLRPMCTCEHGYGTHEDGKQCHGVDENYRNGIVEVDPCRCRRYDGPDPALFGLDLR